MSEELVKRLRVGVNGCHWDGADEAADTIELQAARIAELERDLLIQTEAGKQLGRIAREKDDERIHFRDQVAALQRENEELRSNLSKLADDVMAKHDEGSEEFERAYRYKALASADSLNTAIDAAIQQDTERKERT